MRTPKTAILTDTPAEPITAAVMAERLASAERRLADLKEQRGTLNSALNAARRALEQKQIRLNAYHGISERRSAGFTPSPDEQTLISSTSPDSLQEEIAGREKAVATAEERLTAHHATITAAETEYDALRDESLPLFEAELAGLRGALADLQNEQKALLMEQQGCFAVERAEEIRARLARLPFELIAAELRCVEAELPIPPLRAAKAKREARDFGAEVAALEEQQRDVLQQINLVRRGWGSFREGQSRAHDQVGRLERQKAELEGQWQGLTAKAMRLVPR